MKRKRRFQGFTRDSLRERAEEHGKYAIDKLMPWRNGKGAQIPFENIKIIALDADYLVIWEEPEPSKLEMTAADSNME